MIAAAAAVTVPAAAAVPAAAVAVAAAVADVVAAAVVVAAAAVVAAVAAALQLGPHAGLCPLKDLPLVVVGPELQVVGDLPQTKLHALTVRRLLLKWREGRKGHIQGLFQYPNHSAKKRVTSNYFKPRTFFSIFIIFTTVNSLRSQTRPLLIGLSLQLYCWADSIR